MKQIIQLIGTNSSGKSTTVRKYIGKFSDISVHTAENQFKTQYILCNNNQTIVLGKGYCDVECKTPGCDRLSGQEEIITTLSWLIKKYSPESIIYEGIMYGSFSFIKLVSSFAKRKGYEWVGIFLQRDFMNTIDLLEERNGGADYDISHIYSKYKQYTSNYLKAKKIGLNVIKVNPDEKAIDDMGDYIEQVIK